MGIFFERIVFLYLEINGADANEPPMYFIAFSGDSGNDENVTISSLVSSSPTTVSSSKKSTSSRAMSAQRKPNLRRRCDRRKADCQTTTLSSPSDE